MVHPHPVHRIPFSIRNRGYIAPPYSPLKQGGARVAREGGASDRRNEAILQTHKGVQDAISHPLPVPSYPSSKTLEVCSPS